MKQVSAHQLGPWSGGAWLNEPGRVTAAGDLLDVVTEKATDFWRGTHYNFIRDSGHFFGFSAPDRFTAQLRIRVRCEELYDQAGIMVRVDERRWAKAGVEMSDGRVMLSSVITDGNSDWATASYDANPEDFWMRATVGDGVIRFQVSNDGVRWPLIRLAPFVSATSFQVGPMCCTPKRQGLKVRFSDWRLGAPLGKDLHDLT